MNFPWNSRPAEQPETAPADPYPRLIDKIARFVACEMIEGDYCEFGVFRGASFLNAWRALHQHFANRIRQEAGKSGENNLRRKTLIDSMRFFAFDSFKGLPEVAGTDSGGDFAAGQYAFPEPAFRERMIARGIDPNRMRTVPGWFESTCTPASFDRLDLRKISVAWIDCYLYESATAVLRYLEPRLADGAVLVFDDWFSYRGSPYCGEQRAFHEWIESHPGLVATEFHKDSWKRNSFLINRRP